MTFFNIKDPMIKSQISQYEMQKRLHRKKAFLIMTMIILGLLVPIMLNIFNRLGIDLRLQAVLFAGFLVGLTYCSISIHKADLQINMILQSHSNVPAQKKVS